MKFDKDEIKQSLSIDQVFKLIEYLGGDPQMRENYFVSRTICHNPPHEGSFKLYYYNNTQLFHCYTECNDTMDVFQLIMKTQDISLPAAMNYIVNFFNIQIQNENFSDELIIILPDWKIFDKYETNLQDLVKQNINLKEYNDNILNNLPHPRIINWEQEGITAEVMQHRHIGYNPKNESIVIPHYEASGKLIGIRERTLIKEEEKYGKYKPAVIDGVMYNHALSFNLYNLNNSKNNIKILKKAIVFESEKATMQYASYFGEDNDISVAVCGSTLSQYQLSLLLNLDIQEIIIAFDKQFQELNDSEHLQWCKKLYKIYNECKNTIQISFIFDKWNLLDYKMSPTDKGKDIFVELYDRRIYL